MRRLYIFIIFFCLVFSSYTQNVAPSFTLDQPLSGDQIYIAKDSIEMIPDFEYTGSSGVEFSAEIDPYLLFPPEDGVNGGPDPGDDGVVGTIPMNISVSSTGAANIAIPLDLPAGRAGMTPQLALVYSSQGGNGLLGVGWSLTGLSGISRVGTDLYHEDFIDGVDFDDNDKFALDGNRLILVNEETHEYRTEIETFSKIISHGSSMTNPDWFEVWTKDGQIIKYGSTENSRIEAEGVNDDYNLLWLVDTVKDRNGNYINFVYYESLSHDEYHISRIKYTGNIETEESCYYDIVFHYAGDRSDINKYYLSGSKMEQDSLLDYIQVKYDNNAVKTYGFIYNDDGFYTHLEEIQLI